MDVTQLQVNFLTALSGFETRDKDGKKLIDTDTTHLQKVINESHQALMKIMKLRIEYATAGEKGAKKKKPEYWRQVFAERSRNDCVWWINNWCWILNPHLTKYGFPFKLPFVLTPKQQEYMDWRENLYQKNESGLVYKCRDVGVSWCNVAHQAWHWTWEPGFQGRFGSLKAEEVDDKDDPDSLFQKFRVIIYNLPYWMRPAEMRKEDNRYDTKMKIVNPRLKSVISGQQGENMGRGGRAGVYDIDEWAKVEHAKKVDANLSANTPCRIYTGTPMGRDNDYAEKYENGNIPIFEFNYWDDPRKTKDWFENFSERNSEDVVQQEVLKSFDSFKGGTLIPAEWVSAARTLYNKIKAGELEYNSAEDIAGMDVAAGGKNRTVIVRRNGIVAEEAFEWNERNTTIITRKAMSYAEEAGVETLNYDPIAVGTGVRSTEELEKGNVNFVAVDYRGSASEIPFIGETKPAREMCLNRRAEISMRVAKRFERTYEYVAKGVEHNIEDLIAVCPNQKLMSQLSIPEKLSQHGKWRLEAKEDMARRGVDSLDYFDALMLAFADEVKHTRVIQSWNPRKQGIVEDDLPINIMTMAEGVQNYISIYHSKGLSAGAIGAVWNGVILTVYDEVQNYNATVNTMVRMIAPFNKKVYEYIGNKEMFQKEHDDLFMEYMEHGILLMENFLYNELSSVAVLNEMMETGRIKITKNCKILLNQLAGFMRQKGMPDKNGMDVAMALCGLVNKLQEFFKVEDKPRPYQHYTRREPMGKLHEMGMNVR